MINRIGNVLYYGSYAMGLLLFLSLYKDAIFPNYMLSLFIFVPVGWTLRYILTGNKSFK